MKKAILALAAFCLAAAAGAAELQVSRGRGGAVAAAEENAARVGIAILKQGGNATDAAVAVAFALAVTWPEAGNIGGGGFWIARDANGKALVIDFRETAPRAVRPDLFTRPGGNGKPPSSTSGPLASGVPGSVAGLALAHRLGGKLKWKAVVEPAVLLARDGFVMTETISKTIASEKQRLASDIEAASIFLPGGAPPAVGVVFKQPALAATLATIRDRGADGFYRGRIARELAASEARLGGILTRGDLALYAAKVRRPLSFRFRGFEVLTTPAPSSGPVLAEMALLAAALGFDRLTAAGPVSAHWLAEIEKRAFRDRNLYLGDPDFGRIQQDLFTDPQRLKGIAAGIPGDRATPSTALKPGAAEKPSTSHFSVMDATGSAVAVTTTLNDSFGSARVARGLGFLLNNEMDDFATDPSKPNLYGLLQGEKNAVGPGKRMVSSMCPSIAVARGRATLVWGTPGGSTIPTTNLQVMLNVLLRGEPLDAAVAAPRFHQQDFPDKIEFEFGRFDPGWIAALEKLGHTVVVRTDTDGRNAVLGRVHAIALAADGQMTSVADPRAGGAGLVVAPAP
ncbi:MAG TPA: gamma-glutamyltransferase [Thermoanaerobaculia bacterium]|nr:gamma-glutamyltransferase [Thermoanaerobaculia bacterium]